jgi:hypothetical protein
MTSTSSQKSDCNTRSIGQLELELDELYREGEKRRMENRRELLGLRAKFNPLCRSLNEMADTFNLAVYMDHLRKVYGEGNEPEPYVIKIQAQLCHSLHSNEIQLKQTHSIQRRNKQLCKFLQNQADELTLESGERERKLIRQVQEGKANLDELASELDSRVRTLDSEINELRDHLGVVDIRTMSPETRVKSISDSMHAMMQGIGFEELKDSSASAVLELTATPKILSKSKLWIDLKAEGNEHGVRSGRTSTLTKRSRHGGLGGSRHSSSNSRHLTGGSMHRSRSDHYQMQTHRGLTMTMGIGMSIRNLMSSFDDADSDDEFHHDLAVETPPKDGEKSRLSNTMIGKSLLELVESDDSILSPASRDIKKLSQEVFAL